MAEVRGRRPTARLLCPEAAAAVTEVHEERGLHLPASFVSVLAQSMEAEPALLQLLLRFMLRRDRLGVAANGASGANGRRSSGQPYWTKTSAQS